MEVVYTHCCGLDVHKNTVVACIIVPGPDGKLRRETQTFGTTTNEIVRLAEWLNANGVTHVAMESSGSYWKPIWNILEPLFNLVLANARDVKAVPGRKTDVKDAEWRGFEANTFGSVITCGARTPALVGSSTPPRAGSSMLCRV